MTRASLIIKNQFKTGTIHLEIHSDGYPKGVLPFLKALILHPYDEITVEQLYECSKEANCGEITFGQVGNIYYHYEVDLVKKTFVGYDTKRRWVNAPKNWKERGWHCYRGENGKYGYDTWVKNKVVLRGYAKDNKALVTINTENDNG